MTRPAQNQPERTHVYPTREDGSTAHEVEGKPCWCGPSEERQVDGSTLVVHNDLPEA